MHLVEKDEYTTQMTGITHVVVKKGKRKRSKEQTSENDK